MQRAKLTKTGQWGKGQKMLNIYVYLRDRKVNPEIQIEETGKSQNIG